jgi:hypothetical protein
MRAEVLEVYQGDTEDGIKVLLNEADGLPNQNWKLGMLVFGSNTTTIPSER